MRFGRCQDCKEYKYLPEGIMCPTCRDNETTATTEWVIVFDGGAHNTSHICNRGLTEQEAKQKASQASFLRARPASAVTP